MTDKELREIRRRFRPDKNNILGIRGCIVGENREITAEFYQQMSLCSVEESEKLLSYRHRIPHRTGCIERGTRTAYGASQIRAARR